MTKEIQAFTTTGLTLYAVVINSVGQVWNTSGTPAFETYNGANWTNYDIALTEAGAGIYTANMPAVIAGAYSYVVYERAGVSPATTDTLKGTGWLAWSGTAEIIPNALVTLADDAITASKFDESTAFPLTATDSGSTYIARTGADSDTLETLSDQIDAVPTTTEFELRTLPAADYVVVTDTIATVTTLTNAPTGMALEATLTAMKGAGWTTETLVAILAAIGSAGLTAQQVRDAMKLAPASGSPTAGSVDAHLDSLIAGVSGAGAVECAITVNDGTNPLDGAEVWVTTDSSGTNTVASGTSNALGLVTVMLDAGSYYVWKQLAGYTFTNPQVMVVT